MRSDGPDVAEGEHCGTAHTDLKSDIQSKEQGEGDGDGRNTPEQLSAAYSADR